ncbi:MAG: hypothetical protein JJU29_03220 [Verrucomicrobia bacterium]|nr:hypothetical protein [Verrucomicrobiota bacterium]MCH8510752.1 hypothetical protein [Kiritimatiellia bacterium]
MWNFHFSSKIRLPSTRHGERALNVTEPACAHFHPKRCNFNAARNLVFLLFFLCAGWLGAQVAPATELVPASLPTEENVRQARRARADAAYQEMKGDIERAIEQYEASQTFLQDSEIVAKIAELRGRAIPKPEPTATTTANQEQAPDPAWMPDQAPEPLVQDQSPPVLKANLSMRWMGSFHMAVPVTWQHQFYRHLEIHADGKFERSVTSYSYGIYSGIPLKSLLGDLSVDEIIGHPALTIAAVQAKKDETIDNFTYVFRGMLVRAGGKDFPVELRDATLAGRAVKRIDAPMDVELAPDSPPFPGFMQAWIFTQPDSSILQGAVIISGNRDTLVEKQELLDKMLSSIDWDTPPPFKSAGAFSIWEGEKHSVPAMHEFNLFGKVPLPRGISGVALAADGRVAVSLGDKDALIRVFDAQGTFRKKWSLLFDEKHGANPRLLNIFMTAQDTLFLTCASLRGDAFIFEYTLDGKLVNTIGLQPVEVEGEQMNILSPRVLGVTESGAIWLQGHIRGENMLVRVNREGHVEVKHKLDLDVKLSSQLPEGSLVGVRETKSMVRILVIQPDGTIAREWGRGGIQSSAALGGDQLFFAMSSSLAVDNVGRILAYGGRSLFIYGPEGNLQQTYSPDPSPSSKAIIVRPDGKVMIAGQPDWGGPAQILLYEPRGGHPYPAPRENQGTLEK